jgi:dienelactone hydrolase
VSPSVHRPRRRTIALVFLALLVIGAGGAAWWLQPMPLLPEAQASLGAKPDVAFQKSGSNYEWMPPSMHYDVGLVVYPGAKVPPAAYGPLAQRIAAHGYLVVVVSMPLNLAVLGIDSARSVIAAHPEVHRWAIAGHSLGGAMAAQFIAGNPGVMRGLALWAAYSASDISGSSAACSSVYGTLDAGVTSITSLESRGRLPADCVFVTVIGGNHEQMGDYTGQPDDPPATITRDDQQGQVAEATLEMLARVQAQPDAFPPTPGASAAPGSSAVPESSASGQPSGS